MASMVDSRTVLDQPGAEDLIGRGDMLYQPVDLPRPIRLQGVFVSDDEVVRVTRHWTDQSPPRYDPDVLAYSETDGSGDSQFGWLAAMADDDMVVTAAELVTTLGKASTSMLQTKLKVGLQPGEPAHGRAPSGTGSSVPRIRATRPCRGSSTGVTTGS
jgi:S-DNA-T family DNA segregation ATPase FtsK/SpoIIIE